MFYILAVESPASRQHVSGAGDGWSMVNVPGPRQYPIMLVATNRSTSQSRRARTALVPRLFAEQRLSHLRRAGLLTSPCRAGWFPAAMMSAHSGSCTKHSLTPDQPRYAAARAGVRLAQHVLVGAQSVFHPPSWDWALHPAPPAARVLQETTEYQAHAGARIAPVRAFRLVGQTDALDPART